MENDMLNRSKIVTFIATKKPDSAKDFYEKILGLRLVYDDAFAIVFNANGIMLRVQKVQEHIPPNYTVLGWDVGDIQTEIKELMGRGVKCERYEWLAQDELGVWIAPSGAKLAWFKDPDGNTLSLTQFQ
jgi:catechol 2,3-dioxygenase-like lactoylglutathione lyase family enzyme